jgi:hypothetical protein
MITIQPGYQPTLAYYADRLYEINVWQTNAFKLL